MKNCPFCAEDIQNDAIKCRYCGEFLDGAAVGQSIGNRPAVVQDTVTASSPLQSVGLVVLVLGVLGVLYFFLIFDTSVEVPTREIMGQTLGGGRVNNIGLISQRDNGIVISCVGAVIGVILLVVGRLNSQQAVRATPPLRVPEAAPSLPPEVPPSLEELNKGFRRGLTIVGSTVLAVGLAMLFFNYVGGGGDLPRVANADDVPRFTVQRAQDGFRVTNPAPIIWPVCWIERAGRRAYLPTLKPRETVAVSAAAFQPVENATNVSDPVIYCDAGGIRRLAYR